ncbi:hypothetical protein APHAL10511_000878 [Amanita phalloides]|nr:hypothetical protein APHAL10511_000878 [Amanita phalloides]
MPTAFCTKHDIQELLILAAAQSSTIAIAEELDHEMMSSDQSSDSSADSDSVANEGSELDGDMLYHSMLLSGATLLGFAASLSGDGSRGPYDQFEKCHQFFDIALGWPDRHFHHKFRIGHPTFDHLIQLLEPNPLFHSTGRKPQ